MIGAILFNLQIGSLTPLLVVAALGAFALLRWEQILPMLAASWPLLILPALAMLSAAWSDMPMTTLRYATLYAVTVAAGLMMGAGLDRAALVRGCFAAFAVYSLASILFGRFVGWGEGAGDAWAGLAGSKNAAGDMIGVAILSTIAFVTLAWSQGKRLLAGSALLLLPIFFVMLFLSKATAALIGTVVASAFLLLWIGSRRLPLQARSGIFLAAIVAAAGLIVTMDWWLPPLFDAVLENTGKDRGLTGRVDLWRFGNELIAQRPWFGLGYNAFWIHDNLDAEYLWRMMGISTRMGFSFHSTSMEIIVHMGYVGLAIFTAIAAYASVKLFIRTMLTPHVSAIFACALTVFFALKLPFEVVAFGTMHISTVIVIAALSLGLRMALDQRLNGTAAVTMPRSR